MKSALWGLVWTLVGFGALYAKEEYEWRVVELQSDLEYCKRSEASLLNKGKFVRKYDPKTDKSSYTFQPGSGK